ncbi:MAG: hypothetical protein ACSLFB_10670 [Acidimicrobiales bacterium]
MLFWFAGSSFLAVWLVFRDPTFDHRLVMLGALAPDVIDAPWGAPRVAHTVGASVAGLCVVMLATQGKRLLRRQLLALPIGMFFHLVFDGMWTDTSTFWWPLGGLSFTADRLPSLERGLVNIPLELAGLAVLLWAWRRFDLGDATRRSVFVRTGRLGRDLMD